MNLQVVDNLTAGIKAVSDRLEKLESSSVSSDDTISKVSQQDSSQENNFLPENSQSSTPLINTDSSTSNVVEFVFSEAERQSEIAALRLAVNDLTTQIKHLGEIVRANEVAIDDLQQYFRRNCLLVHGLNDAPVYDNATHGRNFEQYVIGKLNSFQLGI